MPFSKLKGRKVMLCNMIYQRPSKITNWKDYIVAVYRDEILDKKETIVIEDPTIDIFVVKPEYRTFKTTRHFMSYNQLDKKSVKYKNIFLEIAKIAGPEYVEYYNSHTNSERKNLYKYPYVLGADVDIETYYRCLWNEQCNYDGKKNPTKSYFDIEVDQIDYKGNIAKHGECEINAVSFVDDRHDTVYEFLLNNGKNPLIPKFVENIQDFYQLCHDSFDDFYGKLDYKIYMFTDERDMILQYFKLIHTLSPDFLEGWNIFGFDIEYILCRAKELNMDLQELLCDKEFPNPHYYFYDDAHSFEFANKRSYFSVASKTHYIDMTIQYASLRKSQGTVKRVNLGYIAQKELKDTKLDYSDAGNIRTLPYNDYVKFVLYSIKDSLLLMGLDRKVHDTDNLYLISETNNVPYKDALKQTVVFRSLMYSHLKELGFAMGHNVNFDNNTNGKYDENGDKIEQDDEDDDSFEGALNGDPELNNANGKIMYGVPSKYLYGLTIDFDFSAMYPSSILAFNIFATSMIGKIIVDYTPSKTYDVDMGKEYIEDVIAGDLIHIGHKWHSLPNVEELNDAFIHKFKNKLKRRVA